MSYLAPLRSDLKLCIILSLLEGKKKLSELGKETKTRETTILHVLKELEQLDLTTKLDGAYQLTTLGVLEAQICKGCYQSFDALKNHKDFWLAHDISGIPPALLKRVGDLGESTVVKSTGVDLQRVHETYIELLLSSKSILGVSPIFHSDYIDAIKEILRQGGSVSIIITPEVLEKLSQTDPVQAELMNSHISDGSLKIYLNNNLKIALTVTEKVWSLGLFSLTGEYDYSRDLRGSGEEGLEWGNQIFRKILETSTNILQKQQ